MNKLVIHKKSINQLIYIQTDIIIHNNIDTIKKLQDGYSIARYGDGEFLMMIRQDMLYESFNDSLKNRLIEVLTQNDNDKLLLGIPIMYFKHDEWASGTIRGKQLYRHWNNDVRRYVPENMHLFNRKEYYSSFFTQMYAYQDWENKLNMSELKKVWDNKKVVLYMNDGIYERSENVRKLFLSNALSVTHESVPPKGAWSIYDKILESVNKYDKDHLLLVCCGATATIMAYDVSKLGYQVIDLGQVIEDIIGHETEFL